MGCSHAGGISIAGNFEPRDSAFSPDEVKVITKTWKILSTDITGRGSQVFLRLFHLNPDIKKLFPCRDVNGDDLLNDQAFKGHASRFMQAIGAAVDNIERLETALAHLLIGLGRQHIHFNGFKEEYFEYFHDAVMFIWKQELKSKFNYETKMAWRSVFDFMIERLKEGYKLAQCDASKRNEHKRAVVLTNDNAANP